MMDMRKAEEEDKWREKSAGNDMWKGVRAGAAMQYMNYPHPFIKEATRNNKLVSMPGGVKQPQRNK